MSGEIDGVGEWVGTGKGNLYIASVCSWGEGMKSEVRRG